MRSGGYFLQVSAADPAGVYADQYLPSTDLRYRNGFHAHVILAVIHGRLHLSRAERFQSQFRVADGSHSLVRVYFSDDSAPFSVTTLAAFKLPLRPLASQSHSAWAAALLLRPSIKTVSHCHGRT